jgi:hypothetical protein
MSTALKWLFAYQYAGTLAALPAQYRCLIKRARPVRQVAPGRVATHRGDSLATNGLC